MFKTGDLVFIPQSCHRFVKSEITKEQSLDYYKSLSITTRPMLGVFRELVGENDCLVAFPDGTWMINLRDIYHHNEEKSDRIDSNRKIARNRLPA